MISCNSFFKLIPGDNLVKNSFVADSWDLKGYEPDDFYRGQEIFQWPEGVNFSSSMPEMDGDLDDFIVNNAGVTLITARLSKMVRGLKLPTYQNLDTRVAWSSGRRAEAFILNFMQLLPGLDLTKSRVERFPMDYPDPTKRNKIWIIMRPVLVGKIVREWDLFSCDAYPSHIFASQKFKALFMDAGMTGVAFDSVSLS